MPYALLTGSAGHLFSFDHFLRGIFLLLSRGESAIECALSIAPSHWIMHIRCRFELEKLYNFVKLAIKI